MKCYFGGFLSVFALLTLKLSSFAHQWTQLKTRKQNLTRLFQKMQSYQFEQISADPDKPLADGIRPLDTADMERYSETKPCSRFPLFPPFWIFEFDFLFILNLTKMYV